MTIVVSDHAPLVIDAYKRPLFAPRPYKFEAMWLLHSDYKEVGMDKTRMVEGFRSAWTMGGLWKLCKWMRPEATPFKTYNVSIQCNVVTQNHPKFKTVIQF